MERDSVDFKYIPNIDYEHYGFIRNDDKLIFSVYKAHSDAKWREFIKVNFEDFAKVYYTCMYIDANSDRNRKRKLSTFVKSIYDQDNLLVSLLMIKAVSFYMNNTDEDKVIDIIVKQVLPNAGFKKTIEGGRYIWKIDDRNKFQKSIGKAFVINYINSNFDKDAVWTWLKKFCYRNNDGTWVYKNPTRKGKFLEAVKPFLKNGGIIVDDKVDSKFDAFIPLSILNKDATGISRFVLEKEIDGKRTFFVKGVASNTEVDRDNERVSENFIKSMKNEAVGLPLLANSHYTNNMDDTIGVVQKFSGDVKTFEVEARLEDPDKNPNVQKFLNKQEIGIRYGFSVGGRITKAFREFNDKLKKEIVVLDDGNLYHILLTNQPANQTTFAEAIAKSLDSRIVEDRNENNIDKMYAVKHRSAMRKEEPEINDVIKSVSDLPDTAFPINHKNHEVCKDFPHHYMYDGKLYLHKQLLISQYKEAVQKEAPSFVRNHLMNHLYTIGLNKMVKEIEVIRDSMENLDEVRELTESISSDLKELFKAVNSVKKLRSTNEEKMGILKNVISDVSTKISETLDSIEIEGENDG